MMLVPSGSSKLQNDSFNISQLPAKYIFNLLFEDTT